MSNTSITKNAGETIVLTCIVNSNPAITTFNWFKSDTAINSAANPSKYSGGTISNSNLTIFDASSSDIDNYSCYAINPLGNSRSTPVAVNVISKSSILYVTLIFQVVKVRKAKD